MACACHNCSPDLKFNSVECMWCHKSIGGVGKLNSPNGARVCQNCIKDAFKTLEKAIKKESQQ